jgi:hypothetical protein
MAALQTAIAKADQAYLNQHVALEGIVRGKVKKYAAQAQQKDSLSAKSAGLVMKSSEGAVVKLAAGFIRSQFNKSSPALRQNYLQALHWNKIGERGDSGYAAGTFLGQSAYLAGVKINGEWVVVGADSPLLDKEFQNLMKILHIKY